jgi:hypothetical protein
MGFLVDEMAFERVYQQLHRVPFSIFIHSTDFPRATQRISDISGSHGGEYDNDSLVPTLR